MHPGDGRQSFFEKGLFLMKEFMKALRWHAQEDIRLDQVAVPEIAEDEVLIQTTYSGICGSEVHEYLAGPLFIPMEPHPLTGQKAPQTLGHEFGGIVVDRGRKVEDPPVGATVTVNPILSCGNCYSCRRDRPSLCEKLAYYGAIGDGGHAQYAAVKAANCVVIPDGVFGESVAFGEPSGCAYHAVRQAGVKRGDDVFVVGGGPIGQLVVQYAKQAGARQVFLSEIETNRIQAAWTIGAVDEVFNPLDVDLHEEILSRTNGLGVDVAIECCGGSRTGMLENTGSQAVELTRSEGTAVIVGTFADPAEFHFNNLVFMERRVLGSWAWHSHEEYRQAIELLVAGKINVMPLISRRLPLDEALNDGIKSLCMDKNRDLKILIDQT